MILNLFDNYKTVTYVKSENKKEKHVNRYDGYV